MKEVTVKKPPKKDFAAFRSEFDKNVIVPRRIEEALKGLKKEQGTEAWCYEVELLKRAGISTTDLVAFREQFSDHVVEVGSRNSKRVWFVDKDIAAQAREI